MTSNEYVASVLRSESINIRDVDRRILHGVLGCATEAGELVDVVKKALFYGRILDKKNLKEELGDLFWYMALICHQMDWTFEEIWKANIDKLRIRYPEQFTEKDEQARNYEREGTAFKESENADK